MTTLLAFAALAMGPQSGTHRVLVDLGGWASSVEPKLETLLGPGYQIYWRNPSNAFGSLNERFLFPADVLLIDLTPPVPNKAAWSKSIDEFVPAGRRKIETAKGSCQPSRTVILVPKRPDQPPEFLSTEVAPLLKQIARETDSDLLDLNDSTFNSGNTATDEANVLFLALVDVEHNPGTWRVLKATSEQSDEGPSSNAIDNNPDTYWHTRYDPNATQVPHEIVIDLGQDETLDGFSYLARQDGGVNGRVKDFELYLGDDPDTWKAPILKGTLKNSMNEQRLLFEHSHRGRYLRFLALSEVNGNIWTSVAEIGVIRSRYPR
jgi:hypothetical protein